MHSIHSLLPAGVEVLERGWLSSNNILVLGKERAALVDSGYATHAGQTLDLVCARLGERSLTTLANTHLHSDHCGGNAALQRAFPGLQTLIPPGQADLVRHWDPVALTYGPTGQQCPEFGFDGLLEPGSECQLGDLSWQIHAAPGHDPNSVVLFEPGARVLLSADALWQNGFGVVFQELEGVSAFDAVAETLDLIDSLQARIIVPGHGPMFCDVVQALARARSRLEAYVGNPRKHAGHAAKVLLKFKLLEMQQWSTDALFEWAESTAYFELVRWRWFRDTPLRVWVAELLAQLLQSGAARRNGDLITNA